MTNADLLDALRDCYVPALGRNVVELQLVRSATLSRDKEAPGANISGVPARYLATIALIAPSNDEAANAQLLALIENRLLGLEAVSRVALELRPPLFSIL